jgi:hypothetical protein
VKTLLTERMKEVKIIAEELLLKEVLYKDDLEKLIGKRPWDEPVLFEGNSSENGIPLATEKPSGIDIEKANLHQVPDKQ